MKLIRVSLPLGVMLVSVVGYGFLAPTTPVAMGDSDELIGLGSRLGLLHAPGYPLLTGLMGLANLVFPGMTVAHKLNLLAGVLQAGVNGLAVYLMSRSLKSNYPGLKPSENAWLSGLSILSLASAVIILSWSAVIEVFSLAVLLTFGFIIMMLKTESEQPKIFKKNWLWAWFLLMLAMGHHHLTWLLLPGSLWWFYQSSRRLRPRLRLTLWMTGLLITIGIYGLNFSAVKGLNDNPNRPLWSWSIEPTFKAVNHYLMRGVYGGVMIEAGVNKGAYWQPINWDDAWNAGITYFKESIRLLGIFNWLLVLGGLLIWFKKRKKHTDSDRFLGISLLLMGPVLAAYLGGNSGNDYQVRAMTERMYLIGYQLAGLMMPLTFAWLHQKLILKPGLKGVVWGLVLVIILTNWRDSYQIVKAQNQPKVYESMKQSLLKVEDRSLIWCFGDISCFSLIYQQQIEGLRPDVIILTQSPYLKSQENGTQKPSYNQTGYYPDNPFRISDITATSLKQGRNVYMAEMPDFYRQWLGLDQGILMARKDGMLVKVGCHLKKEVLETGITRNVDDGSSYINAWYQAEAKAVNLSDECVDDELIRKMEAECQMTDWSCQIKTSLWLLLREPQDIEARLSLARAYENGGFSPLAKREYEIVLSMNATNSEALIGVNRLREAVLK